MHQEPAMAYLIADGARARLLLRHGDGRFEQVAHLSHPAGERRSAVESDDRDAGFAAFAEDIAAAMKGLVEQAAFERLVLVAPSHLLSALHESLARPVADRVVGELHKDLTKLPEKDLHEVLNGLLFPDQPA